MTTQTNIVPEILSLKDVELYFNLSANTIKRERWEQKQVRQNKLKLEEVKNLDGLSPEQRVNG